MVKDYKRKTCFVIDISVPTNTISVKEYDKISKCKNQEIEIEKMWPLETTTMPVIAQASGMIEKETDKYINFKPSRLFAELLIFFGEYYQYDWEISCKRGNTNINTYNHYLH